MTLAVLRDLHALIGNALDDIEAVYREANSSSSSSSPVPEPPSTPPKTSLDSFRAHTTPKASSFAVGHAYASPPPSPSLTSFGSAPFFAQLQASSFPSPLDFPSLDAPYDPSSPSEALTSHPAVLSAINRIVAAAGHISMSVQTPFLSICDAAMGYHLPSCLRLLEASNVVEILRDAGPEGLHVKVIAQKTGIEKSKIAHTLRLLATHHILREVTPDVFTNNRVSSLIDTGKSPHEIQEKPEQKYRGTNGISAFVGMCTDELQKSSAYITEAYLLSNDARKNGEEPTHAPFNFAFGCEGVGFFNWLEGEGVEQGQVNGPGRESRLLPGLNPSNVNSMSNSNQFRLERFGAAMTGTDSWEVPGAVFSGFEWQCLPRGSVVVDVGGGIGSTTMILAHAFSMPEDESMGLKFIVQDRPVVVDMGIKAWREKCPEFLDSGVVEFQAHDFFLPQPIRHAAVYFLRVILHDWPDDFARRILLRLREASGEATKLVLADFVLPLACHDDLSVGDDEIDIRDIVGAETSLAPAPLLPNLGKASAHGYWMDLTMQATFNGQERTLRETVALAASAGWKVVKIAKAPGSIFGHVVAVPAPIPFNSLHRADNAFSLPDIRTRPRGTGDSQRELLARSISRCGTPTLGSKMELPSLDESRTRFGLFRGLGRRLGASGKSSMSKLASNTGGPPKKKKPSPLSVSAPIPISTSPRSSLAFFRDTPYDYSSTTDFTFPPPTPLSPRHRKQSASRESSFGQFLPGSPTGLYTRPDYPSSVSSPSPVLDQPPPSPRQLSHHASLVHLNGSYTSPRAAPSSPIATRARNLLTRRTSHAQLFDPYSPGSSTSTSPVPPIPALPPSYSSPRSPMVRKPSEFGDSPLSRKKSEGLLSLSPFKPRHGRNRSGGASSMLRSLQTGPGRKIAFGDQNVQDEHHSPTPANDQGMLEAPVRIERPRTRSKSRPASPF